MERKVLSRTSGGSVVVLEETQEERERREAEALEEANRRLRVTTSQARRLRRAAR